MTLATEIEFGIEIETVMPKDLTDGRRRIHVTIGHYHDGVQVDWLPAGWNASRDSSINYDTNTVGCEIVSPRLRGHEGLAQVVEVVKKLNENGFKVNSSCGVHVSVNWGRETDSESLARLVTITSYLESAVYAATGTHSRELSPWCKSVRKYAKFSEAKKELDKYDHSARYHLLNLTNLHRGQDRVEFRAFSGSLNIHKITAWIMLCVGIVERAKMGDHVPAWTGKASQNSVQSAGGVGQFEMRRLLNYLGWSDLAIKHDSYAFGVIDDTVDIYTVCDTLRKMAKKYDAELAVA